MEHRSYDALGIIDSYNAERGDGMVYIHGGELWHFQAAGSHPFEKGDHVMCHIAFTGGSMSRNGWEITSVRPHKTEAQREIAKGRLK